MISRSRSWRRVRHPLLPGSARGQSAPPAARPANAPSGCAAQLAVDPVRLRPSGALLHRNARGIEHEVRDPSSLEQPEQPKAVVASLVATHHARRRSEPLARPGTDLFRSQRKLCHYGRRWACLRSMLASDFCDGSSVQTQTCGKATLTAPWNLQTSFTRPQRAVNAGVNLGTMS